MLATTGVEETGAEKGEADRGVPGKRGWERRRVGGRTKVAARACWARRKSSRELDSCAIKFDEPERGGELGRGEALRMGVVESCVTRFNELGREVELGRGEVPGTTKGESHGDAEQGELPNTDDNIGASDIIR